MSRVYEFTDSVNLRGLGPVDVMMETPSPGPHAVMILDMWKETSEGEGKSGKTTYRFNVVDTEPGSPTLGVQTQVIIGCDTAKDFNVQHTINALLSIGAKAEKIQGVIPIAPQLFKGKSAFIYVRAPPEGEIDEETGRVKTANKNFITPAMYEAAKKVALTKPAGAGATAQHAQRSVVAGPPQGASQGMANAGQGAPAGSSTPQPGANAGQTPSLENLFT
jgi:hypothetical protein